MSTNKKRKKPGLFKQKDRFRRAFAYAQPHKSKILLILLLTITTASINVIEPLILKFIFDRLASDRNFNSILGGILVFLAIGAVRELCFVYSNSLSWKTRLSIHFNLLNAIVERLHLLPFEYSRKEGVGAIMTRMERGINGFITALSDLSFNVLPAIFYLVFSLVVMLQLDWRMTLLVLFFAPLPGVLATLAAPKQVQREKYLMSQWGKIYSRFNEVLSGIVTVRSFAMEDYEKSRFLKGVSKTNNMVIKGVRYDTAFGSMQNLVVTLARISAISLGGYLIFNDQMTIGSLVAFLGYVSGLFGPVQGLTSIYKTTQTASVSLDHIFSILDTREYLGDAPDAIDIGKVKGKIVYDNVVFAYVKNQPPLLKNINLTIHARETVALVGPSGSGKSTITALLQRFYDPDQGRLTIDGIDLRKIRQKSLRSNIGVVLQDALLFNESVRNNIAYGRPEASDDEIEKAARVANIHERIVSMENGYHTLVGERGNKLSVGERQRIAIARAILKDPPILILDEATSALDAELEAQVQEALEKLIRNRTTFIIAHRLATVVNANRILVMKNGKIIESGNHRELMGQQGYYRFLVDRQTKGLISRESLKSHQKPVNTTS
jgi:ATP-binding cassette subfamily B protein